MDNLDKLTIGELFTVVEKDWQKPYFGAVPYIEAGKTLVNMQSTYIADTADTIVGYFLNNARTWKGDTAKAVKAELQKRLKKYVLSTYGG